jgi:tocopherol cyclase
MITVTKKTLYVCAAAAVLLFSPSWPALASDPYNALIWNGSSRGDWYEWWYYKVVVPETREAFYFCYGVVNPWDLGLTKPASRSYVSFGSFGVLENFEQTFTPKDFTAASGSTFVKIGENTATDRMLQGHLTTPDGKEVSWDLTLEKNWGVNVMGWTIYQPGISNIFWYPAQASASMSGRITYRGKTVSLNRAPAYQDRNWGKSFPKWWAWLVSNHFKNSPGTVLAAGGGRPKIFPGVEIYEGMAIGLRHQGREYIFSPSKGDQVRLDINFGKWEVSARNRQGERLELSGYAPRDKFLLLQFMTPQGKLFNDYEALLGYIRVKLYTRTELIADLETDEGGIEFGSFEKQDFEKLFSGTTRLQ